MDTSFKPLRAFGWLAVLCGIVLAGCAVEAAEKGRTVGRLPLPPVGEASGLAASGLSDDVFWTHNDSGGKAELYAVHRTGRLLGAIRLRGVKAVDWEDLASFTWQGQSYLVVGDVGDNGARRRDCQLLVVAEPELSRLDPTRVLELEIAWSVPVRYPEGPLDCESLAVDAQEGFFYLLAKRMYPAALYRLPFHPAGLPEDVYAERVGKMASIPQPSGLERLNPSTRGAYLGMATAMDFSTDRTRAVVLTYAEVLLYTKGPEQSWLQALSAAPAAVWKHDLAQAEAAGFGKGSAEIWVTTESEKKPAKILSYPAQP